MYKKKIQNGREDAGEVSFEPGLSERRFEKFLRLAI